MGELIVNGIKWAFYIAIGLTFMTAISTLLNLITEVALGNVVGEILGIISCCLPFNALAVFSAIGTACSAILSFLIAQKIWELTGAKLSI